MARFIEFLKLSDKLPVVSMVDMAAALPGLRRETVYRWRSAGLVQMIAPGYYIPSGSILGEQDLFAVANLIYRPSFVSLESALSYHGLIPETAFSVTSVSTRKTRSVLSPAAGFIYRTVKPGYWFGYSVVQGPRHPFLMALPERALLDMLYLRKELNTPESLRELRLDREAFGAVAGKLAGMALRFGSRRIMEKCAMLTRVMEDA